MSGVIKTFVLLATLCFWPLMSVAGQEKPKQKAAGAAYADKLVAARLAAVEGGYEECAKLSDQARRTRHAHWRAHQVYASCTVFAADAQKDAGTIEPEGYAKRIRDAVGAMQLLIETPGLITGSNRRQSIYFMIEQLSKRADDVLVRKSFAKTPPKEASAKSP